MFSSFIFNHSLKLWIKQYVSIYFEAAEPRIHYSAIEQYNGEENNRDEINEPIQRTLNHMVITGLVLVIGL